MALLRRGASRASNCTSKSLTRPLAIYTPIHGRRHISTTNTEKPPFNPNQPIKYTQTPNPTWKLGDGAIDNNENKTKKHIPINPSDPARAPSKNYKFLISSIVPRPIALISTLSPTGKNPNDGKAKLNLAPFSYFQVINHDPPMFVVSFTPPGSRSPKSQKDTLRNLTETGECVINVVSEHMLQAANATTINAEYGDSEFDYSGLTPAYDTETVNGVPRVLESIVSIEGHLIETKEFESRVAPSDPKKKKGRTTLAIIEGTRFWVREDAIDATELAAVDLQVLRPVSRLGGDAYGRTTEVVEIERPIKRS
ncbi:uncharacterized protein BHQ10_002357 [Talaromyces amestolkiae]|uniref:Flavin reductase like domain-containing protein n=1 Tax=Talaromyces amestolkiae TaxID=1196081 RepID=A0A364KS29_TALAM|nr:uncharacterized protein BHQ10_002357 [Talaromyces amestolkiae]RAO66345.1 hypothetical protein BHQ10_002357 [Talaromyces amestolkiae]